MLVALFSLCHCCLCLCHCFCCFLPCRCLRCRCYLGWIRAVIGGGDRGSDDGNRESRLMSVKHQIGQLLNLDCTKLQLNTNQRFMKGFFQFQFETP